MNPIDTETAKWMCAAAFWKGAAIPLILFFILGIIVRFRGPR